MTWVLAIAGVALAAAFCLIELQRRRIRQICAAIAPLYLEYVALKRMVWVASAGTAEEWRQRVTLLDDDVAGHA